MPRIVHLGLGNFHRAHQAWYTAQGGWKITGVVMRNRALYRDLVAHGGRYVLGIWGPDGLTTEVMDVFDDVLLVERHNSDIRARIADETTQVVTLTITEKGYGLLPATGRVDLEAAALRNDMCTDRPASALGLLAHGLVARRRSNAAPITLLSCDNLAGNGAKLRQAVLDILDLIDAETAAWVRACVEFPTTMVDRITPSLSDAAIATIRDASGQATMPVVGAEAFTEWVIEDAFAGTRPDWDRAGAVFTDKVTSFEQRKLRMLNAAHSYLAYAGLLRGHRFVHEAVSDAALLDGMQALWDEAAATVSAPASNSLDAYRAALLARFRVPDMRHSLRQIAQDGSLKLRERVVPIIDGRRARGLNAPMARRVVGGWICFVKAEIDAGTALLDPNAAVITDILATSRDPAAALSDLVGLCGA